MPDTSPPATVGRVVTIGETLGLLYTDGVGRLSQATDMKASMGGAESNVAIALTRLGTPASWIGRVGADSFGERIVRELRAEGVDIHAVIDSSAFTGLMLKERLFADTCRVWYYRSDSARQALPAGPPPRPHRPGFALARYRHYPCTVGERSSSHVRGDPAGKRSIGPDLLRCQLPICTLA